MDCEMDRENADCRQLERGIIGLEAALVMTIVAIIARVVIDKTYEYCMLRYIVDTVPIVTYLIAVFMLKLIPNTKDFKKAFASGVISLVFLVIAERKDYLVRFTFPGDHLKPTSADEIYSLLRGLYTFIALTLLVVSLLHIYGGIVTFLRSKEQEVNFKSLSMIFTRVTKKTLWAQIALRIVMVLAISAVYMVVLYINTGKLYDKAYDIWAHEYLNEEYSGDENLSRFEEAQGSLEGFIVETPSYVIKNYEDVVTDQNAEYGGQDKYKRVLNVKKKNIELVSEESIFCYLSGKFGGRDIEFFAPFHKDKVVKNGLYLITLDDEVKVGLTANINLIDHILDTNEERVNLPGSFLPKYSDFNLALSMSYWDFDALAEQGAAVTYISALSGLGWEAIVNIYCMKDYTRVCLVDFIVASVMTLLGLMAVGLRRREYYLF